MGLDSLMERIIPKQVLKGALAGILGVAAAYVSYESGLSEHLAQNAAPLNPHDADWYVSVYRFLWSATIAGIVAGITYHGPKKFIRGYRNSR